MAAKLTVGLVVHNDPRGLVRSAACVFHQTWGGDRALTVVDNGSTDETPQIISNLQKRYGAVQVIRNDHRAGPAHARNRVIREAAGDYLAWIDAGDLWHPRKLELQFQALREAREKFCFVVSSCKTSSAPPEPQRTCEAPLALPNRPIDLFPTITLLRFSGLLGTRDAVHRVGELDERLSCLADEEFLLRLALSGVPFAAVESDHALFSARTSDQDHASRHLAADFELIWHKHRIAVRRRFGWKAAAEYRRRQLLTVARAAFTQEGGLQSARYGALAGAIGLATGATWRGLVDAGARPLRKAAQTAAEYPRELRLRLTAASSPKLTTALLTALFKLVGVQRRRRSTNDLEAAEPSPAERAANSIAHAKIKAGKFDAAAAVLEAHVAEHGLHGHPSILERLADALLAAGRLDETETLLERGLSIYPSNGNLQLKLAATHAQMSKWQAATTRWEELPDELKATANVWTCISIARAYRLSGEPNKAYAIAMAATALHPCNDRLETEIELCRPSHVEWSRCLVAVDGRSASAVGKIDRLGFLNGGVEPLAGRVVCSDKTSPEVGLHVNDVRVASTLAAPSADGTNGKAFSINCAGLLRYLGDGDVVQVLCEGAPVTLPGLGAAAMVYCGLPSRFDPLRDRLRRGYVFTSFGRLRPGHTEQSKQAILDFFEEVARLIEDNTGFCVFPFYGNLLGAVREGDFIDHDVAGFDILVVCESHGSPEVKAEFTRICRLLIEHGYHLKLKPWGALIKRRRDDTVLLDLSYGWFDSAEEFKVSFGWRFRPVRGRAPLTAHRVCRLNNRSVRVPGNAEAILSQVYGPQWRVPDQGYSLQTPLRRDESYLMTAEEMRAMAREQADQVEL